MPSYDRVIDNIVAGDDIDIVRTVGDIPTGQYVDKAWLTVKADLFQDDSEALFQKVITDVASPDGIIADPAYDGTVKGVTGRWADLRFQLSAFETDLMEHKVPYVYDVQIRLSSGKIATPEMGTIKALRGITQASS
jgi:hypothetical protein